MRVARQVTHPRDSGQGLVAAGATLRVEDVVRMHELGVYDLWIDDLELGYLEALHRSAGGEPGPQRLVEALTRSFQTLGLLGIDVATHPLVKRHRHLLEEVMAGLVATAPTLPCFRGIVQSDELLQHSADVAVLSTLLGLQLENYLVDQRKRLNCRAAREVLDLAVGAFFHDVGETLLPPQQRESRASLALDPEAGQDWKQHTQLGYAAVRTHLDPPGAAVVLHHHQHFDGSGFAWVDGKEVRQSGRAIHVFARIAGVADQFHHLLMEPEAGLPRPAVQALWRMQKGLGGWFDPTVLGALVALVPAFAPGMVVTLSDRRSAVVTRSSSGAPCHPEVQVLRDLEEEPVGESERIDLSETTELRIAEVGREDVTAFVYGSKEAAPLVAA